MFEHGVRAQKQLRFCLESLVNPSHLCDCKNINIRLYALPTVYFAVKNSLDSRKFCKRLSV